MTQQQTQALERIGKELKTFFPCMHGNIQFNMNPEIPEVRVKYIKDIQFKEPKR